MFNAVNILEALKNYIHTRGGTSNAYNIAEAVNDLNSIPQGSGGDIPPEVSNAVETHGMGWTDEEEVEGFDIQWDGNTEGLERVEDYVKISDLDIPNDQIVGLKFDAVYSDTHEFLQTTEITQELFEAFLEVEQINDDYAWLDSLFIIHKDGVVVDGFEFAHKGIYVGDPEKLEAYISRLYKEVSTEEVVHQIDQKYIPQSSGGGGMVVHFEINPSSQLTPITSVDKTPAEVLTAMTDGVVVTGVANWGGVLMPLGVCSISTDGAVRCGFMPQYVIEDDDISAFFLISSYEDGWVINSR